jgi:hypothetical protein
MRAPEWGRRAGPVRSLTDGVAARVEIGALVAQSANLSALSMEKRPMLWLAILLVVAWVLGFAVFKIAGGLIHLLLLLAVVVLVYRLVTGRRVV